MPWFSPKDELVILRGIALDESINEQYVKKSDDADEEVDMEREFTLFPVQFMYSDLATDNLLTKATVAKIASVERALLSVEWSKRCRLTYPDNKRAKKVEDARCASGSTLLNFLYVNDEQHENGCDDGFCVMPKSLRFLCGSNSTDGIAWGTHPCRTTVFEWTKAKLAEEKEWNALLNDNLCKPAFETKLLLDRDNQDCEDVKKIVTKYSRSLYTIGYPLRGFKDREDRRSDQAVALSGGIFGRGKYGPLLIKSLTPAVDRVSATRLSSNTFAKRPVGDKTINVYLSEGVTGREADTQFQAIFLAIISLIFVFIYIWFNVGSIFLAITGVFEIVASLPLAWFFWRIIMQQMRLDIFAFSLIIFLILCIGADDIFVFMDTWKASATKPRHISGSLESRLQWTYAQASSAMFTTTATTVLALLMTATSTIPFIAGFGIFGALVVTFDYILVVSWFPVSVIVYEQYFTKGCFAKCCACLSTCKVVKVSSVDGRAAERKSVIFIRDRVAPAIFKHRNLLFGAGLTVIVAMSIALGVLYKVAADFPNFYVASHPYNAFAATTRSKFFVATDFKFQVSLVYGYEPDLPVNRALGGQLTLDIQNDEDYTLNRLPLQIDEGMQSALVQDCEDLHRKPRLVDDRQSYCLLNDLKKWRPPDFPYKDQKKLRKALDEFFDSTYYAKQLSTFKDYSQNTGFVADGDDGFKSYWVTFNTTIPIDSSSGPESLLTWQQQWEAVADEGCATKCFPVLQQPPISVPVNWEFMTIIQILESNVWSTMLLSVACAWVVLILVTRNWWISTMVAVVIIAIMVCVISLVFMIGYILDIFVSTFIALVIGLAIDYSVHIAHFYGHAEGNRYQRTQHALGEIALSVIGGAVTTIACGIPLFAAPTATNSLFGYAARAHQPCAALVLSVRRALPSTVRACVPPSHARVSQSHVRLRSESCRVRPKPDSFFICFTAVWSVLITFVFFVPALMIFGPERRQGTFAWVTDRLPGSKGARGAAHAVGDKTVAHVVDA